MCRSLPCIPALRSAGGATCSASASGSPFFHEYSSPAPIARPTEIPTPAPIATLSKKISPAATPSGSPSAIPVAMPYPGFFFEISSDAVMGATVRRHVSRRIPRETDITRPAGAGGSEAKNRSLRSLLDASSRAVSSLESPGLPQRRAELNSPDRGTEREHDDADPAPHVGAVEDENEDPASQDDG